MHFQCALVEIPRIDTITNEYQRNLCWTYLERGFHTIYSFIFYISNKKFHWKVNYVKVFFSFCLKDDRVPYIENVYHESRLC